MNDNRTMRAAAAVAAVLIVARLGLSPSAQSKATTTQQGPAPVLNGAAGQRNWPLHSLDLSNSRYSPPTEITTANVSRLTSKWTYETEPANIGEITRSSLAG